MSLRTSTARAPHPHGGGHRAGFAAALPALLLGALLLGALLLGARQSGAQEALVHAWQRIFYAPLDGKESLLFIERFERAKPALADLDGDGDLDLFLGTADGRVMYFENRGSAKEPRWMLANPAIPAQQAADREGSGGIVDVGANAAPALVDIDGDGDMDLFVGSAAGKLWFYRNQGNRFLPNFVLVTADQLGRSFGLNLVPALPDLNSDGLPDLSFGNEAGEFFVAINQGTRAAPRFCLERRPSAECLTPLTQLGRLDPEDNAVPAWSDWDRDGDLDLFVGKSDGTIAYFQNIGNRQQGAWELVQPRFNILDSGGFAAPVFADLNGDGVNDLLLAGDSETLAYYTRRLQDRQFPLWLEDKNLLQVRRLGGHASGLHVTAGDLDADGDLDLVIGTHAGELLLYENVGSAQAPAFKSPTGPLLPTPQRSSAAPSLADVDGDGDLDLLVGGREGRLEWIENAGSAKGAQWIARSLFFGRVDVGSLAVPHFADVDGDGDLDLLVGNSVGNLVFYENTGSARRMELVLREVSFGGVRVPNNAAPGFFGWNAKGPPDLIVGNQTGSLIPAIRNPAQKVAESRAFRRERAWSGGLQAGANSAPLFADLSGDKRPDLLLGTGGGGLLYWRYEGSAAPSQVARGDPSRPSNTVGASSAETAPGAPGAAERAQGAGGAGGTMATLPLEPILVHERSSLERLNLGRGTKPAFFDANGDGRLDLVVGTAEGKLILLQNEGDERQPTWRQATDAFAGYDKGRNAAPVFADLDGDGDADLIVGNEQGRVSYWENTGSRGEPRFEPREEVLALVRAGRNAVPAIMDLNGDGLPDLLLGNLKGEIVYYQATARLRFELSIRRFIGLDVVVNATPSIAEFTARGPPFLVVGSDSGKLRLFSATGTSRLRSSGWREAERYFEGIEIPPGVHAAFGDIDSDGDVDMVLGSDKGRLSLVRNHAIDSEGAPGLAPPSR